MEKKNNCGWYERWIIIIINGIEKNNEKKLKSIFWFVFLRCTRIVVVPIRFSHIFFVLLLLPGFFRSLVKISIVFMRVHTKSAAITIIVYAVNAARLKLFFYSFRLVSVSSTNTHTPIDRASSLITIYFASAIVAAFYLFEVLWQHFSYTLWLPIISHYNIISCRCIFGRICISVNACVLTRVVFIVYRACASTIFIEHF